MFPIRTQDFKITKLSEAQRLIRQQLADENQLADRAGNISGAMGLVLKCQAAARAEAYRQTLVWLADVSEV